MGNGMNKRHSGNPKKPVDVRLNGAQKVADILKSVVSGHSSVKVEFHFISVVDGLYLGNIRDAENKESLSKNGITHILSVYNNAKPVFEMEVVMSCSWSKSFAPEMDSLVGTRSMLGGVFVEGQELNIKDMKYLCIHAADASSQNLLQHFKDGISFIHDCRLNGGSCLVHCLAGVSRSTTMVVAYLMTVTHYSWDECLTAVKAVRSFVGPNYGFQQQLQEYQTTQVSEYRTWLQSTFHPSPFNDQEQVGALLSQYTEQQESQRRRADQRWISQSVCTLPSNSDDPEGSN